MTRKKGHSEGMLPARIIQLLNAEMRWMTGREIADTLGSDRDATFPVLKRLYNKHEIDRRIHFYEGRALWQYRSLEVEECPE